MRAVPALSAVVVAALVVRTPAASTVTIAPGGDLQAALNDAHGGDTILLTPGASYTGNFVLPARGDDDTRPITIRTAGSGLPGDGERVTPAASGRLARLQSPNSSPALATAPATHDWVIQLIEFGPNQKGEGDIIDLGDGSNAQRTLAQVPARLTLDRVYVHGDPVSGQKRGIALNSASTRIAGSYISDIKAVGQDSQAIGGWNGPGDYLIENDYLEAAGENLMFGGADPAILNLTPTKIIVRNNYFSKPLAWRGVSPAWQVKNILELKNARTVLVEHNLLEHSWQQAQAGYAILLTVRNQDGGCGWCQVEDVQLRANVVRDVAAGIQVLGTDNDHPSRQTNRIFIADNLFQGIDSEAWGGDGYFLALSSGPRDVTIDHNTIVSGHSSGLVKIGDGIADAFKLTNNVAMHGSYGIIGTDHGVGNDSIRTYLPGAQISTNVIAGGSGSAYPPGNLFPSVDEFKKQFVDFAGGDFRLVPGSRWLKAGTDGRDLGANISDVSAVVTTQMKKGGPKQPAHKIP